ncbi:MAG: Gfo/Idh/MocA family oxidoreductase [Chthoniobacterales bacterium]|nr:Gfo/Idh/MocA family oxidoreductase [Chthoniobacterales bacterium]
MKTIGFIDYYVDEWHANMYPGWIRESAFKDRFDVTLAWEEISPEGKKPLRQWCEEQKVRPAESLAEVVEQCDCLVVLSPDNPERHEDLSDLALRSGKPVYVDKPFAPSLATALRMFDKAQAHGTPLMSCSALRFAPGLQEAARQGSAKPLFASGCGGGSFGVYAIHQLEMLVMVLGTGARRVRQIGSPDIPLLMVDYEDGRRGTIQLMPGHPFQMAFSRADGTTATFSNIADFFPPFIEAMLRFFETKESPVPRGETLEIAALLEAGHQAMREPETWHPVGSF